MDTFVDSSWYFLRYPNPSYQDGPFDPAGVERWLPVAEYIGGREHACGHLIYARFMTKVLHDMGLLSFTEPFTRLTNQGDVIMNGRAMSKTLGNLVSLQEQIAAYGPDAVRVTMLFAGPPDQDIDWADVSPTAAVKWLGRVTRLLESLPANPSGPPDGQLRQAVHRLLHSVTVAMDGKRFNVAIARLMELTTLLRNSNVDSLTTREGADALVVMLSCFAPLTAAQLGSVDGPWPMADPQLIAEETVTCVVQVNGKVRARLEVPVAISEAELEAQALACVGPLTKSRVIVRAPRIVNIVTS
jgi:leucyl-tRNA synthetase